MTNLFRVAIGAALTATMPLVVLAQASSLGSAPARSASGPAPTAKPAASNVGASYTSAFEGYRRFENQKTQPWRDANDNVGRIGGWQAYAREAAGGDEASPRADHSQHKPAAAQASPQAPAASTPSSSPAPAKPAANSAVSMPHDAHKGHGGHSMPKKP